MNNLKSIVAQAGALRSVSQDLVQMVSSDSDIYLKASSGLILCKMLEEQLDNHSSEVDSLLSTLSIKSLELSTKNDYAVSLESEVLRLLSVEKVGVRIERKNVELECSLKKANVNISNLKKKSKEDLETLRKTLKEKSRKVIENEKRKCAALRNTVDKQGKMISALHKQLDGLNGTEPLDNSVAGKTKGVRFFIHEYSTPLTIHFSSVNGVEQLRGARWHLQVMRNSGVSVSVSPTIWLTPILPKCSEMEDEWTQEINERLHSIMLRKAKEHHKTEYLLTMAAKKYTITNLADFTDVQSHALKAAKLITLFDAVSLTLLTFVRALRVAVPSITDEEIEAIRIVLKDVELKFIENQKQIIQKVAASVVP